MNILPSPNPAELAKKARETLAQRPPESPREHFIRMVREGRINSQGELTRLFGGQSDPEPERETWTPERASENRKPRS